MNQYCFAGTSIPPPRWMELSPHEYKAVERNILHQLKAICMEKKNYD